MEAKKLILYLMLISSIIAVFSQTPMIKAVGRGQHTFISGRNVDCVECHRFDAYMDMNSSQTLVLEAHKRAAGNKNYTTYLQVGGTSYDPAGIIYTNVDSDSNGANDIWIWNSSVWFYNNTARLYDLDLNKDGSIEGAEICKLCHSLELMGVSNAASEVHTVGTRYCDDDRCHGNRANQYNSYLLFQNGRINVATAGAIISGKNVHGTFYNDLSDRDSNHSVFFRSYGQLPGNAAPGDGINVSLSPFTCLGCHSYINITGSIEPGAKFDHSNTSQQKGRYN